MAILLIHTVFKWFLILLFFWKCNGKHDSVLSIGMNKTPFTKNIAKLKFKHKAYIKSVFQGLPVLVIQKNFIKKLKPMDLLVLRDNLLQA